MKHTMSRGVLIVIALNVAVSFGDAGQLGEDSKLKRELDAQLPAESRHTFPDIDKQWIKTTRYVDPVLFDEYDPEKVSEEQKRRFEKQELYSRTGKKEGDRRVLTYDPAGRLRFIEDWRGDDEFVLSVYADGSIRDYMHGRKGKVLEAYAVSPDGSEVYRVVRGSGMVKRYSDKLHDFARLAYHDGDLFFRGHYTADKLDMVWLSTNQDKLLRWREGSEEFFVNDQRTWWGRTSKGDVQLKRLDGEYDLKKVDPDRVKLWQGKYAECISAFLDRYDALLKKAGYTWAKLEIEFVRMGKPFPNE